MENSSFILRCSKTPFSDEELDILERYGKEFERLSNGDRTPTTAAQVQLVEAACGERPPETVYELAWTKYLQKLE